MFARLMHDRVTLRKPVTRGKRNKVTYEEVLDTDGGPLALVCRLDLRRRRVRTKEGTEKSSDGAMFFRRSDAPKLDDEHLVVYRGKVYRVMGVSEARMLFTPRDYARADLALTRETVPADAHETLDA